jgi:hypothetical protein
VKNVCIDDVGKLVGCCDFWSDRFRSHKNTLFLFE